MTPRRTQAGGLYCAVLNCNSCTGKMKSWKQQLCELHGCFKVKCCTQPYQLHRFPNEKSERSIWTQKLRRENFTPNNNSGDNKPSITNPHPELLLGYDQKNERARIENSTTDLTEDKSGPLTQDTSAQTDNIFSLICKCQVLTGHAYVTSGKVDVQTQVHFRSFSAANMNAKSLYFYTGHKREVFSSLANAFELRMGKSEQRYINAEDQLFLILCRLRLNLLMEDVAYRFEITLPQCSTIFGTGIVSLSELLTDAIVSLPKERIRSTMPQQFDELYPSATCVIDCSEIFSEKPEGLMARAKLYSNYKAHNTVKYLIAVSPGGFIMFVSKTYGGRASDKFICHDSKFLDYLNSQDKVMVDRGFEIEMDLAAKGVSLNIPRFIRGRKLSEWDCTRTRRIASIRIHIERVIGRMKNYRILKSTIPLSTIRNIDHIVTVCAGLTNLK